MEDSESDPNDLTNDRPQYVSFWIHVGWVAANWAVAIAAVVIRMHAQKMYQERVKGVFDPVNDAWVKYYEAKCPQHAEAVRRLPR